jgi:hypothetical protein
MMLSSQYIRGILVSPCNRKDHGCYKLLIDPVPFN